MQQRPPRTGRAKCIVNVKFDPQACQSVRLCDRSVDADAVPLRTTDRTHQRRVRTARFCQYGVRAEGTVDVPGRAAQQILVNLDGQVCLIGRVAENLKFGRYDFQTYVIATEGEDLKGLSHMRPLDRHALAKKHRRCVNANALLKLP